MVDVAGGGHIGIGLETTHGTYIAPTKYAPVESENLAENRGDPWRKPMVGQAVTLGKVKGREHVAGSITMEAIPEIMAYFFIASRFGSTVVKTGAGPYVYTFTDSAVAHLKANSRSLTIVADRAGLGFAYLGCQTVSHRLFFDDGILKYEASVIGRQQTESYTPGTPTIPTEVPFAVDEVDIKLAGSSRLDIDSFEMSLDDNGEAKFNLSGAEAADYVKFGEHVGEASFEVDFESKADYALWVARTTQELILDVDKSANQKVNVEFHAGLYDNFEVGLGGIGDQVRASAGLRSVYAPGDTAATKVVLTTSESITV